MPGYPQDLLSNRSVVKPNYAIITPEGRVINVIPGIVDAKMTILCSPKIGAGFAQLIGTLGPDAHTTFPYASAQHEEAFISPMLRLALASDSKIKTTKKVAFFSTNSVTSHILRDLCRGRCLATSMTSPSETMTVWPTCMSKISFRRMKTLI